jgi:hypothetical protein
MRKRRPEIEKILFKQACHCSVFIAGTDDFQCDGLLSDYTGICEKLLRLEWFGKWHFHRI